MLAPLSAFSYAVKQDGATKGDVLKVPFVQSVSASAAFDYNTGYSGDHQLITAKDVTLNQHLYQTFNLTDADMARLGEKTVENFGLQAGQRLANDVISASLAIVVNNANFATTASVPATSLSASSALVTLNTQCDNANWDMQRNLILGPEAYSYLLSNTALNTAYSYGSSDPIQKGVFQNVYGFTPYKVTVSMPNGNKGLVLNPNAILIGMAPHTPATTAKNLVDAQSITDDKSGLTIGMRNWYDPDKATTRYTLECLFGASVGNPSALFHLK